MQRQLKCLAATALLALAWAAPAFAGPIDFEHVPADAKWVAHLDAEACRSSKVMTAFREHCTEKWEAGGVKASSHLRPWSAIPLDKLQGMTLFGTRLGMRNGAAVLTGDWDRDELQKKLQSEQGVQSVKGGEYPIYSWTKYKGTDAAHDVAVAFPRPNVMVFASGADLLKSAVDVIQGNAPSLADGESSLAKKVPTGTILMARAANLGDDDVGPHMQFFRRIQGFDYAASESGGQWSERLDIFADDEKVAENLKKTMDGMVAFMSLCFQDHEKLVSMMNDAEIRRDGRKVHVSYQGPAQEVANLTEKACDVLKDEWQSRRGFMRRMLGSRMPSTSDDDASRDRRRE